MENVVKDSVGKRAWQTVRHYYASSFRIGLVFYLIWGFMYPILGLGLSVILLLPLLYGVLIFSICAVRRNGPKLSMIFCGFDDFMRIAGTLYLRGIYIILWGLLFTILGIIKSYSYAMTPFLLYDHPELKYNEALERSKKMMDGHKVDLFGWDLLLGICWTPFIILWGVFIALLIFSTDVTAILLIGVLVVVPVVWGCVTLLMFSCVLYAEFYEDLKEELNTEENGTEPERVQTVRPEANESRDTYMKDYR